MAAVERPQSGSMPVENSDKKDASLHVDENGDKLEIENGDGELPSRLAPIEALGIENWQALEKKLVRRLDLTLMPCLWLLYIINYLDRASIAQSRISSLDADLGLEGSQFSTAVSILFVGYVIGQLPSNMILTLVRPSLYLPCCAIVWSGVSAATAGVKSYEGLVAVRFVLGLVEAPLFPGAMYLMSCWYTRRELATRTAVLMTGLTLGNAFSGLIAAAVFATLEQKHGLAGWQWLFIILATMGAIIAVICMFVLPDYPHSTSGSARWSLTEDMRRLAVARIQADRVSDLESNPGLLHGLKLSVLDYRTWILVGINITISVAYGFSNFYPAIVRGFGYGRTYTLLLTAPPYILAAAGGVINSWHADRTNERGYHFSVPIAAGLAGYVICLGTTNRDARYGASYLYVVGMFTAFPLLFSWTAMTLGRTPAKKATSIAIVNLLGQIGNTVVPYFFLDSDEPRYQLAFIMMMVFGALCIGLAMLLKFCLHRANRSLLARARQENSVYNPYTL
jgi:MFS family permease